MIKVFKINMPDNCNVGAPQLSASIKGFMDIAIAALDITEKYDELIKLEAMYGSEKQQPKAPEVQQHEAPPTSTLEGPVGKDAGHIAGGEEKTVSTGAGEEVRGTGSVPDDGQATSDANPSVADGEPKS